MRDTKWRDLFGSEWERIRKHGEAIVDPEEKRVWWDTIRELKRQDPNWSFESIQPTKKSATERARDACCSYVKSLRRPKAEESA